jgi:hypothetical protein
MIGIFARSLLPSAPSWISKRVYVWGPEIEPGSFHSLVKVLKGLEEDTNRFALLKALASVDITVATSVMRASSNAAPIKIG